MSVDESPVSVRPLEHWRTSAYAGYVSGTYAHEVDLVAEARNIRYSIFHDCMRLRRWLKTREVPPSTVGLRFNELFVRYPVDPERWWRKNYRPPPQYVRFPDLNWGEPGARLVPLIRNLYDHVEAAANLLAARDGCDLDCFRPSDAETLAALDHLVECGGSVEMWAASLAVRVEEEFEDDLTESTLEPADDAIRDDEETYHEEPYADEKTRRAHFRNRSVLIRRELHFRVFRLLSSRLGHEVPQGDILKEAWKGREVAPNTVQKAIGTVRRCLETAGMNEIEIRNCRVSESYVMLLR